MKEILEMLDMARYHIDGQMNCKTPEYHALDYLHRAAEAIALKLQENERVTARAANVASCLANGIQPD